MKTLSSQWPRPSIEIGFLHGACEGEAGEQRGLAALKISGLPKQAITSSIAVTQKSVSIVLDNLQARTFLLNQSMIATRYRKHRDVAHVYPPDLVRPINGQMAS